jgi:hypothetical protein
MARPHEDRERHTLVDHRPGGTPVTFAAGAWCALELASVEAARTDAALSAYETLVGKAQTSAAKAGRAAILRSTNGRRVIVLLELDGHAAFRHVAAAWDDHHLEAGHRAVAESGSLALYRLDVVAGEAAIDPGTHDAYAFERVARAADEVRAVLPSLEAADGFRGALLLGLDDAETANGGAAILYRFTDAQHFDAFRASATALQYLGPIGETGETVHAVHPVKTFTGEAVAG